VLQKDKGDVNCNVELWVY